VRRASVGGSSVPTETWHGVAGSSRMSMFTHRQKVLRGRKNPYLLLKYYFSQ
jgi:hypothetical protein